jgi:RimJ/RimL family protein N-acetyltransferase
MEKPFLETERLIIRKFDLEDAGFIVALLNSPGWLEYIGDRQVRNEDEARAYLSNGPIQSYQTNGFGLSMVMLKEGNIPIGACGLLKREYLEHPDIGFAFLPAYTGQGYGFESADAVMNYAKNDLKLSRLFAFTIPQNKPSIKLLEKMGFQFDKKFMIPGEEEELLLFIRIF